MSAAASPVSASGVGGSAIVGGGEAGLVIDVEAALVVDELGIDVEPAELVGSGVVGAELGCADSPVEEAWDACASSVDADDRPELDDVQAASRLTAMTRAVGRHRSGRSWRQVMFPIQCAVRRWHIT